MRVRVCVLFLSHEEKKEKRESALFVCADFYFVSSSSCLLGVWRSLRQQEKRETDPCTKKGKREKRVFIRVVRKSATSRTTTTTKEFIFFIREEDGAAITA